MRRFRWSDGPNDFAVPLPPPGAVLRPRDAAKRILEADEAADTARLLDALSAGGSAGRIESASGAKRVALADAEHVVEIANRAVDQIASDAAAADQRLAAAGRAITEAVCAVLLEAQRGAEAILRAVGELDARRHRDGVAPGRGCMGVDERS